MITSRSALQSQLVGISFQSSRCFPIPANIQGQVRRGSEQPGLVEDVPAHCRGGWAR